MGSGCLKGPTNKVKCNPSIFDQCVYYTGASIPELGICTGDTYDEVIQTIITKLNEPDPEYPDIKSRCEVLSELMGDTAPTLKNIVDAICIFICQVKVEIDQIVDIVNQPPFIYNLYCLTVTGVISTEKVLQELIKQHCNLVSTISTLQTQVNNIQTQITTDGIKINSENPHTISQSGNTYTLRGFIQPYMPLPYIGPLTNFDSSGKGIASLGWKDWYIMNGNNGTQDWRGFSFAGATSVPGPTLNGLVNPATLMDPDAGTSIGSTKGKVKNKIAQINLPDHGHTVNINDPGHQHNLTYMYHSPSNGGGNSGSGWANNHTHTYNANYPENTTTSTTGITVSVGSMLHIQNVPMENRPPTKYGVWVVWIP